MIDTPLNRSKGVGFAAAISVFFFLPLLSAKAQTGLRLPPVKSPYIQFQSPSEVSSLSIGTFLAGTDVQYPRSFNYAVTIDSSRLFVTLTRIYNKWHILAPYHMTFNEYLSLRSDYERSEYWREYVYNLSTQARRRTRGQGGLTIETPKIRSEAFRRVFGGETLSLNVRGKITIDGTMRHEKRSQVKTATDRAPNTNFQMKQTQKFTVEGKIGENVSILVNQDSERPFEFENAIKLRYASDEDGIIKSIEAGNVALSLPSTRFVTFSAQNTGLFGIKTQLKIGNLDLTAIASVEKGEKKTISLTGGKEEETFEIHDYDYRRSTYFFLDHGYARRYPQLDDLGRHLVNPDSFLAEVEVYKSDYNYEIRSGSIRGWAVLDPHNPDTSFTDTENYRGYFIRLEPISDYYIKPELGYIVMNMPLQESEVLAVSYKDTLGNVTGTLLGNLADTTQTPIFKLVKPRTPRHTDQTWNLEWKNVYYLGSRNIDMDGFELKMYYKTPSGDPQESIEINGEPRGFLNLFGLDNLDVTGSPNPDNVIDDDPNILSRSRGELIFPNLRPFDPDPASSKKYPFPDEMESLRTPAIYDTTSDNYIRQQSKFYLEVQSSRRSPNLSLGMNVIEGSEEVLLNGVKLQKDVDYMIDYLSGTLTLLNEDATNPNADLKINYESHQMISIDKKSLFGARAEYTLWETGNNRSFIGATLLYLSQSTLDQRIRIGKDAPMNNLVWDVNSSLQFQPGFLTSALDALPLLEASSPSTITLEGEIAQVIPNPNTLNNESTGDHDGVAYLDDFEGAKRDISLSVIRSGWGPSSPPTTPDSAVAYMSNMGRMIWYNPYEQVPIQEIWPDREVTTNYGGSTLQHVLTLRFTPNPNISNTRRSWGGIQRALAAGYADQTDSRFLEIWVKGDRGRVHVDLGQISEDVIPNQFRNTEDKTPPGGVRNEILDEDEDTGLDGIFGSDPPSLFHPHENAVISGGTASPYDFYDLNADGVKQEHEPWSYDDWFYESMSGDYRKINGTEGNRNDGTIITPDSEDLNRNSDVDLNNNFFRFTFSLEKNHADTTYIAGGEGNPYGWRMYRIPLDKPAIYNNPDWSRVEFTRIWVDSVDQESMISFAEINLVGNEWKIRGVRAAGDSLFNESNDSTMTIAVTNTHDNPEYTPPPGVEGVIDPLQNIQSKEQSLIIDLKDLGAGETAIARKDFYQSETLIYYKLLKMFVHGGDWRASLPDSTLEFFLQWGSDTKNEHYYEARLPVYAGWDERNNILVDFEDLSRLKIEMETLGQDSISEVMDNGHLISVVGKPSLTNIRWLIVGIRNISRTDFTGQVWIDELRVSDVRKDKGMAMRARADIKLSDFITINGEYNRKDADFHTVNERFGGGSNSETGTFNASIQLNKLLPTSWGIRMPLSVTYNKSRQTPKYLPGSDILVSDKTVPDSLLKRIRTESETRGLNLSLSKSVKSRNFLIRYLIDPIQARFSYTTSNRSDSKTLYADNVGYKGSFSYNLNFGQDNYLRPFKWLGENGIFKKLATAKFFYLPRKLSIQMNGNDTEKNSETSGGVVSNVITSTFNRTFSTTYNPFEAIGFDYTHSLSSDMREATWPDVLSSLHPGDLLSINQQAGLSFNPQLAAWLTTTAKYNANYRYNDNPQQRSQGTSLSASVNRDLNLNGTLSTAGFVRLFRKKTPAAPRRTRRPVTRRTKTPDKTDEDGEQEEEKEKKPFPLLSALSFLGKIFESIDPIKVTYRETKTANNYGILGDPSFEYQMGFTLDPGVPVSPNVTSDRSSRKEDQDITVSSGFKISSNFSVNLDYRFSDVTTRTTQTTGTVTRSALLLKDKDIPFPNWRVSLRGLEKLPVLNLFSKSVSLNHDFSGRKTTTWNDIRSNITQVSISRDFRPLVRLTITMKNGITANAQYTMTETIQEQKLYGVGQTKSLSNDLSITFKYATKGGFKLPFFRKKLQNSINISVTFAKKYNGTLQKRTEEGIFTETSRTENWTIKPSLTYSFTRTVQGGVNLELGARNDLRSGKTSFTAFGLNAVISLSGN
jgi:cell surface protein SprA